MQRVVTVGHDTAPESPTGTHRAADEPEKPGIMPRAMCAWRPPAPEPARIPPVARTGVHHGRRPVAAAPHG
jgi:hypothetical protein